MVERQQIQVCVTIDFGFLGAGKIEETVAVPEHGTVLDALRRTAPVVTSRRFGMEYFVQAIGGIKNDLVNDRGWQFEVNGHRSNVPAERYLVKNGDWIKWIYLPS
jgi:hypothetical protein